MTTRVNWKRWYEVPSRGSAHASRIAPAVTARDALPRARRVASSARVATSDPRRLRLAEETRGPEDQHTHDERQRGGQLQLGADDVGADQVLEDADRQPADHGPDGAV